MGKPDHKYLVIPGPVEVRREILEAQTKWMIGHRSTDFANLFARLQDKLKQVFLTQNRVLISGGARPLKKSRQTGEPNLKALLTAASDFCNSDRVLRTATLIHQHQLL